MSSKRSRLLVDPQVQWTIAARIVIHWTTFLCILVFLSATIRTLLQVGNGSLIDTFKQSLWGQAPLVAVMLVLLPVFVHDTLKLSNRFAGPMYRLRTAIGTLSRGEETRAIKFREGDFWHDVAGDFNVVLANNDQLKSELESLRAQLKRGAHEQLV